MFGEFCQVTIQGGRLARCPPKVVYYLRLLRGRIWRATLCWTRFVKLKTVSKITSEQVELIQLPVCDTLPKEAAMTTAEPKQTTTGKKIGLLRKYTFFSLL